MRARCSRLLAMLYAFVGLALASTPAYAVTTHPFLRSFDGSGTPNGAFSIPGRVAVDQGSGDVYVVDVPFAATGGAIQVFDSSGTFLRQLTGAATPAGTFRLSRIGTSSVAIDASGGLSDGDVYVADTRNGVVAVFDSLGLYERQLAGLSSPTGVAVDQNGHVWVVESDTGEVNEYDAAGTLLQTWVNPHGGGDDLAVDSDGNVYLQVFFGEVYRFSSTGTDDTLITDSATGIAVDPDDDHLYVNKRDLISEYDETGAPVIEFGSGRVANSVGVAVHGTTGNVFVTNSIAPRVVNVFGPLGTVPNVSVGPATEVTTASATVSGTINPDGLAATWQFEWGTDTDYGNVAPAAPVEVGDGTADVPVTAELSGLAPGTTYHYRLKGTSAEGSNFSQDATFTTPPLPVIVSQSGEGGLDSATLTAQINPQGFDTTYHFEYGLDTTYGASTPETALGSGFDDLTAPASLSGLSPGKTYHFRVVATNAHGTATGDDATFATTPPPSISNEAVFDIGQDSATVHAWINPNGEETAYQFEYGATDAYGSVTPATPASIGSSHDKRVVIAKLAGLAPGTAYHYRVIARSAAGVTTGSDHTFSTRPCGGAACEGPHPPPATPTGSGSGTVDVTPTERPRTPLMLRPITRKQIANWGRTARLRLKVTVGGRGEVRARATAKLPGYWEPGTVARDSQTAATAGVVTLTLKLSRAARRALADFRLPVTIVVSSTGADRTHTVRVTLKKRRVASKGFIRTRGPARPSLRGFPLRSPGG